MEKTGAARKALIFTESRRTQEYLKAFLESNGYPTSRRLQRDERRSGGDSNLWSVGRQEQRHRTGVGLARGDVRTALIEHFRDEATILLATEAAAEGINLQFCLWLSTTTFLGTLNVSSRELAGVIGMARSTMSSSSTSSTSATMLTAACLNFWERSSIYFNGVFGASDEVLGVIESGVDFEKSILAIYQECRTSEQIEDAFRKLQQEMDEQIRARMDDTRKKLFESFRRGRSSATASPACRRKGPTRSCRQRFWLLTKFILEERARFDEAALAFDLNRPPQVDIGAGRYHLISKSPPHDDGTAEEIEPFPLPPVSSAG